jgi:hypothetical protein
MTMIAIATETTDTTETTHDDEQATIDGNAYENQRSAVEPQPETSERGTAYLPGAIPGAIAINWK